MRATFFSLSLMLLISGCSSGAKGLSPGFQPGLNKSGLFGIFVQKLGFTSGGSSQIIHLRNVETGKTTPILVKPALSVQKESFFSAQIRPGTYELFLYSYSEGINQHNQYILKAKSADDIRMMWKGYHGKKEENQFPKYTLEIKPGEMLYVGTWDFSRDLPEFRDEIGKAARLGEDEKVFSKDQVAELRLPE